MNSLIFIAIVLVTPAQAYLDPGTGSMLLSTIIALVATLIYSFKSFIFKIKSFISRLFGTKIEKIENSDIVIYNEGNQYFTTFYPIIKELNKRNIKFTYLHSEKDDLIVKQVMDMDSHYIDKGNKAFFYLNTLEAKMCIMTTPGLDVLQIKRSKGVSHYCHISHSTGGCRYEVYGVDYFDSVLVPNKYDKEFIRGLEEKRGLPEKEIYSIGTPYLDYNLEQLSTMKIEKSDKTTILVSPTWGEHGLLAKYGVSLLEILLTNEVYEVIVRPHPQSISYETEILESLKNKFKNKTNLIWDYTNNALESMSKASLMISDFSGIILDFVCLFSKPVISLPGTIDLRGKDYIDINKTLWQIDFYNKYTTVLQAETLSELNQMVEDLLGNRQDLDSEILEKYNPYFSKSSIQTVNVIENIIRDIVKGIK